MRREDGFSLIEVLIASTVLAIGVASLAQLFTLAVGSNLVATRRTHGALLAAQKLEELRSFEWGSELVEGSSDRVGEFMRQWSVGPLPGNAANAVVLDVFVTWNRSRVVHLATIQVQAYSLTLTETLVAMAVMIVVTSAVLSIVVPAQGTFQAQPEVADMEQRLRVAADALTRDLVMASAVLPYRAGPVSPDPPGSFFDDRITIVLTTPLDSLPSSRTYYLRAQDTSLMQYDGDCTDLPVVDHVVKLAFEHVGFPNTRRVRVTLRIEASTASLRGPAGALFTRAGTSTSAERFVPDRQIRFDVAPRNIDPWR